MKSKTTSTMALLLGLGGLIPFVSLSPIMHISPSHYTANDNTNDNNVLSNTICAANEIKMKLLGIGHDTKMMTHLNSHVDHVNDVFMRAQLNYASSIISFLGAVHWGMALQQHGSMRPLQSWQFLYGVLPSVAAWLTMSHSGNTGNNDTNSDETRKADMLISLLLGCYAVDVASCASKATLFPMWYINMRTMLTTIAVISLYSTRMYLSK